MRWLIRLIFNLVLLFARLEAAVMPTSWLFAMGRWSARLMFRFLPGMRAALLDNALHLLGPESSEEQRAQNGVAVLTSFSRFFVELLTPGQSLPLDADLYQLVDGMEHAEQARDQGKGVICVTLHMGNYELGALLLPKLVEQRVAVVYRPDPWGLFEKLRSGQRQAQRVTEIPIKGSLFTVEARRVLEEGGVVLATADAGFAHERGKVCDFLGGRARFVDWPVHLSRSTGAPLVPCVCYRTPEGGYRYELRPAIQPGDVDAMLKSLLEEFAQFVRRFPDQWLILHRYWLEPDEGGRGD